MIKKLLLGVLVYCLLVLPSTSHASFFSDAVKQIFNIKTDTHQLKGKLGADAIDGTTYIPEVDPTPRIAYWGGKVNQHVNSGGDWVTDPDGTSGANLDKLAYCKKWYSNTVSITDYTPETITTWREAGNVGGPYTSTVMTTQCVQGTTPIEPYISVISPNGGEVYQVGGQINVTWKSYNPQKYKVSGDIYNTSSKIAYNFYPDLTTADDGSETVHIQTAVPPGQYKIRLALQTTNNQNIMDESDATFTINSSSTTTTPSITIISPNGGETYTAGQQITVTWKSANITATTTNITLSTDRQVYVLAVATPNDGSEVVTLPTDAQFTQYQMSYGKIFKIYLSNDATGGDLSDNTFTINPSLTTICSSTSPSIKIISPNGGEVYKDGQAITLNWTSCNLSSAAIINLALLSYDNSNRAIGSVGLTVTTTNDGSETVNLPTIASMKNNGLPGYSNIDFGTHFKVMVSTPDPNPITDISDSYFTIPSGSVSLDPNPRIAYWLGKVNQHMDASGVWQSDPDGTSGADIDKLTYCKKWYPNTTSVEPYKSETITTWRRNSAYEQSAYTASVVTDHCVFPVLQRMDTDSTPRIMYWWGKVNQHVDASGSWQSDPDGTSGADLDKLTYCQKWYPSTTSVEPYKSETISTWRRASVYEQSGYNATVVSDKCVGGVIQTDPVVALPPDVIVDPGPDFPNANTPNYTRRTLKIGVRGDDVRDVQTKLNIRADGIYGPGTAARVRVWQRSNGLKADGAVGPQSRAKLSATVPTPTTNTSPQQ